MADVEKKPATPPPDAGLRNLDHYKYRLPKWRYALRQKLLPLIRWETPYLAYVQEHVRTPALDTYFALSANLGTHTFFMAMLPTLFWFGYTAFGRGLVHILAAGVFFSGFLKDLLCLPRPLSPPLHRITMSGSAALEYGFPSTHSTNAVSVAFYALAAIRSEPDMNPALRLTLQLLTWLYTASIVLGRLYCGMHGFLDVIIGSILGALLGFVQWNWRREIDDWVYSGEWVVPLIVTGVILLLVRIHPEPADECPCFDDGVAFAGVVIGVDLGHWHFAHSRFAWSVPEPATVPFAYTQLGLMRTVLRVILGVVIVFSWRGVMKPTLHRILPPVFRLIEQIGLSIPRKDYKQASEYTTIPPLHDDTLPPLQQLPALIQTITRRSRSDSVGPQSAADAYETLAYREKRRRESIGSDSGRGGMGVGTGVSKYEREMGTVVAPAFTSPSKHSHNHKQSHQVVGTERGAEVEVRGGGGGEVNGGEGHERAEDERREEAEMFMRIERPRVRYDVEVVTKLVVYAGIAWLAVEWIPVLFELAGLGLGVR
ncbi:phosphatidic acid phosphatase type 2/haloperoxidase [Kalaharituber pfeilii]|nr:phosphatidic acid phosphatase type 2/haloperoxidase [Kalaharituber pfeilii]